MARPTWKGFLKLGLVHLAVRLYSATETTEAISFHQLHGACRTRIQQKRWCATCAREVAYGELAKGVEVEPGRSVVVSEEDLATVTPESTRVIDLAQFTEASAIDPLYLDRAYYLVPEAASAAGCALVCEGLRGKAGIGRLALYGRESRVAVLARGDGLVLFTLRNGGEVRSREAIDQTPPAPAPTLAEVKLVQQVIALLKGDVDWADRRDAYQDALQQLVATKVAGGEVVAVTAAAPAPVQDLREALRQSLLEVSARKKKTPAKTTRARSTRARSTRSLAR